MEYRLFKNIITTEERKKYVAELKANLPLLRLKAGISQDELAGVIGVSRQTYGAIERGDRPMGWNTYLSLIFFFDNQSETHSLVRAMDAFPHKFISAINIDDTAPDEIMTSLTEDYPEVFDKLDDSAITTIRALIMIEYARCTNQSGDVVIRTFDGMDFMKKPSRNTKPDGSVRKLRGKRKK